MAVSPGSIVVNAAGRQSTVGPLILCEGNWYTFVPAHTFQGERKVREAGTGLLIGEIVSRRLPKASDTRRDITDALRLVRLFSYAPVQVAHHPRVRCADPLDFLGEQVLKRDGIATISSRLESVDGPFAMAATDGEVTTYLGAFGIEPEYEDVVLAKDGDGGASIISPGGGELVGVLIGIADDTYYCVPGDMLMARYFPGFENLEVVA
ncbi:hypothetical protein OIU34_18475 [Pararhizobium sp. BT-229]|uniref:hypothetical protein n=1 Tax=Pararhizobium sp. BT-229 TaxID=2986923 RepID=UPI0021F7D671|nr:hypothetical protein [Pararhizobium sp. BT-229]MCV9963865.1 hypothetical protein [Pararhizobium sp. BT-229]